jgi:hypothetical protein
MNSRERITLHAEHAGWSNVSTEASRLYWCEDEWKLARGRKTLRIVYDVRGRVLRAVLSTYKGARNFIGTKRAQQVIEYILEEEKKANGGVHV